MKNFITQHGLSHKPQENYQNYDFEGDLSIDHHIKEEAKELQISMSKDNSGEGTPSGRHTLKDMLNKAKTFYTASWNDVRSYVGSLTGTSLEELDAQASTAENIEENGGGSLQYLDSEINIKKKWVVYDMVKLGFRDDQIRDGVDYLDKVSEELTRGEMLKKTIDYLLEQRRSYDHIVELETDTQQILPKVCMSKAPEPPRISLYRPSPKKEDDSEEVKDTKVEKIKRRFPEDILEDRQRELASRSDTETCPICFNYFLKSDIKPILNCSHAFCQSCCVDYLNEQINNNKVLSITCPNEGCPQVFQEDQIKQLITRSQLERYSLYKKVALLNQNPDLRWCIRPGCDKYVIGKKGMLSIKCECGMKMCFKCGNGSHFGKSCEAAIDKVYKKYAREQNVQICPQCKSRTEKTGGCHHITCTRCAYEWCWLCGKQYTQDHYSAGNPDHCKKIEINADDGRQEEEYIRDTYCSRMARDRTLILGFPLFLVIMSAMMPQHLYTQYMRRKRGRDYDFSLRNGSGMVLLFALLGILLLPISLVYMLVVVIIDGVVDFYVWLYKKAKGRDMARKPHPLQPNVI